MFYEILEYCKANAIANTLQPNEVYIWRKLCRDYSKKFNEPLTEVMEMNPEHILTAIFEDQLDSYNVEENIEDLVDKIYSMENPEYEKEKEDELKQFIEDAETLEKERIKNRKPIHKALKDEVSLRDTSEKSYLDKKNKPASGSINLEYLEKLDNEKGEF
jgi:hypothetical protein